MKPFNSILNVYKPLKAKKGINKISAKQMALKKEEDIKAQEMLEICEGKCMICGKIAPLEKNHTRNRKRFLLSCHECHSPKGIHRYLDEVENE